jgi:hypothetical protein
MTIERELMVLRYRRFDVDTFTVGPAQELSVGGAAPVITGAPAIAPINVAGSSTDRLVFVFHRQASPTWFHWTYIGSGAAPVDMGSAYDSDVDPSLVAFPHGSRIYMFRADASGGATSRHIRYGSYTVAGGWSGTTNLTTFYNADAALPANVVRTDRGVALAQYSRVAGSDRLRMSFVTVDVLPRSGSREIWFATLRESAPGVLDNLGGDYRAVPLVPALNLSAGGLAPSYSGHPLWSFLGSQAANPKIVSIRMFGN